MRCFISALCGRSPTAASNKALSRVRLTVNKGNAHATAVYEHYGYRTVEAVQSDIGGGYVMDDYIMVKRV